MKQMPTQDSRKQRSLASTAFITFLLLTVVIINVSLLFASVRQARAAALVPMTTPSLPGVSISSPTSGSLYTLPTQISIAAIASDSNPGVKITWVEFYSTTNNNTTLLSTSTMAPYSALWVPSQAGIYTLTAKAYDSLNLTAISAPVSVEVEFQSPPPPPVVTITSPANNSAHPPKAPLSITASVTDSDPNVTITRVEFYSGTTLLGTSMTAPYSIIWTAPQPGSYTLTAKAYDNYGDVVTSAPITIFIAVQDPVPPTVIITSPANSTTYNAPATVMIAATASDVMGPLRKVDFYNGSTLLGTSTSAPYHFTWANVPVGIYTLKAVATDAGSGVTGTSAPITITVLPGPPPGTCKVNYQLSSQWSGGFQANLVITNMGMSKISGWVLKFTFPGDQKITNLWNGNYTQSGEQVTISNLSWNGTIPPGGSVNLGFNGTWTSNNTSPTLFTLNGQVCN